MSMAQAEAAPAEAVTRLPTAGLSVVAWPKPFARGRPQRMTMPHGLTVAEILDRLDWPAPLRRLARVEVGDPWQRVTGQGVPPALYAHVRPNAGTEVRVWSVPQGGGGKNPLRAILTLGVLAAAFVFAAPLGTAILGASSATIFGATVTASQLGFGLIGFVGNLLINALLPPPQPRFSQLSGQRESPTLSISGARNQLLPFGQVPRVLGRHKVVPPKAHPSLTESQGYEQYVRDVFVLEGPVLVEDIRIGTVPIDEYEDVEYHIHQNYAGGPLKLWSNAIVQDGYGLLLAHGEPQTVATRDNAFEVTYDFSFQGLGRVLDSGNMGTYAVEIDAEYRLEGATEWTYYRRHRVSATTRQLFRKGFRLSGLTPGRYELRFTKVTPDAESVRILDEPILTMVRTVQPDLPIRGTGLTVIETRIRATNQLNGPVDELSFIATSIFPAWDGSAWVEQPTRHPSAHSLHVLRGSGNRRPIPDSRIDWAAYSEWAEGDPTRTFDAVIDYGATVKELLTDIAAGSRAAPDIVDGLYTIVRDLDQPVPVQFFGPRNILKFSGRKNFFKQVHGLRLRFTSPDRDWRQDERRVYAPGYDAQTATDFEVVELFGVTDADLAYRDGLYRLAESEHRGGEAWSIEVDIDHLRATRGRRVRFSHDVPQIGLQTCRLKAMTDNGTHVTTLTLDERVPMAGPRSYAIEVRRADGSQLIAAVATEPGEHASLTLTEPLALADAPEVGDFATFGEAGQTMLDVIVKEIRSGRDETARLTLVPYAPEVRTADQGTIPPYVPLISTDPRTLTPSRVQELALSEVLRFPGGRAVSDVVATWQTPLDGVPAYYRVLVRLLGDGSWTQVATTEELSAQVATDRSRGDTIECMVIAVSSTGRSLPPAQASQVSLTLAGDQTPPDPVTNLRVEQDADTGLRRIRWRYAMPPPDLAGFYVRFRPGSTAAWSQGEPLHEQVWLAAPLETTLIPAGVQTIMVRAIDHAGNLSDVAARTVTLSDVISDDNIIVTTDYRAAGWPGTIDQGEVAAAGELLGAASVDPFYAYTALPFWGDEGEPFWAPSAEPFYDGMGEPFWGPDGEAFYDGFYPALTYTDGFTATAGGILFLQADGAGDIALFWREAGASEWTPYAGRINIAAGDYEVRAKVLPGTIQAQLTELKAHVDVRDLLERISDAAIAAGGTRLSLTRSFSAIENVSATVQEVTGEAAVGVRVVDKSTAGPLIQCFDASGAAVAGTVDATIQGY